MQLTDFVFEREKMLRTAPGCGLAAARRAPKEAVARRRTRPPLDGIESCPRQDLADSCTARQGPPRHPRYAAPPSTAKLPGFSTVYICTHTLLTPGRTSSISTILQCNSLIPPLQFQGIFKTHRMSSTPQSTLIRPLNRHSCDGASSRLRVSLSALCVARLRDPVLTQRPDSRSTRKPLAPQSPPFGHS